MRTIKILGFGDVVQSLLHNQQKIVQQYFIEIYCRNKKYNYSLLPNISVQDIKNFSPSSDDIIFYCCSVDEESVLRENPHQLDRSKVARLNAEITKFFIEQDFFNNGIIFVLTNPSDVIAEYIFRETNNQHVYALGAQVDALRYKIILSNIINKTQNYNFDLWGTHSGYPYLSLINSELAKYLKIDSERDFLLFMNQQLKNYIRQEFNGFKPPVESGAFVIAGVLKCLAQKKPMQISAWCSDLAHFAIGYLSSFDLPFKSTKPTGEDAQLLALEAFRQHHEMLGLFYTPKLGPYESPDNIIASKSERIARAP